MALAPTYGVMLLLLGCSGFGCGFIYPTAVKAIMLWFPQRERATALGVNQSAVNVSGMLGAAIMPALALSLGWQSGFVLASIMAFAICGVAVAFYREPRPGESAAEREAAAKGLAGAQHVQLAASPAGITEPEQGLPLVTGDERLDRAAVSPGFLTVVRSRDILLLGFAAHVPVHDRILGPGAPGAVPQGRLGLHGRGRRRAAGASARRPAPSASRSAA